MWAAVGWAATVWAHGPPAAVVGVAAVDAAGPVHIRLTEGLAVREADGWRYVCPTRWGGSPLSPYAGGDDARSWLPGAADLVYLDGADGWSVADAPDLAITGFLALDGPFGLYVDGAGRRVWDLAQATVVFDSADGWSSLAWDGAAVHLIRAADGQLWTATWPGAGDLGPSVPLAPALGVSPLVRWSGAARYAIDRAADGHRLLDGATGAVLASAVARIDGPVAVGGADYLALDGLISRLDPAGPVRTGESRGVTCLDATPDGAWACAGGLYALGADGLLAEAPLFALDALLPPDLSGLGADGRAACWIDWQTWSTDVGEDAGPLPGSPESAATGCAHTGRGLSAGIALWAALLVRRARRQVSASRVLGSVSSQGARARTRRNRTIERSASGSPGRPQRQP